MTYPNLREQIRTALADETLQAALDANAANRLKARQSAYASLPEPLDVLRQRAHAVRAETIDNLEVYLDQFIAEVESNGVHVHRAADAEEAVAIALEIARREKAKLVAKSKTMVSEEIELNAALEGEGIRPVETDLGEYIVQLRGEPPSHIITPSVHLRRQEVGQTFHEKLGIPYTDNVAVLTEAARATLRQTFLDADIGISGVNLGVAETGSLCIVTNEGNGRMVTTVPPVHIALMGVERLVPGLDDLALMLQLLPRSATGQKITVYVQLIHGPRRAGEVDGASERHLILVDNGRTNLRGTPLQDALMCIRCGACINACPIFREIGGHSYTSRHGEPSPYPGPIGSVISPGLFGTETFGHLAQASTLCGACKQACPIDIDLPTMLARIRAGAGIQDPDRMDEEGIALPWLTRLGLRAFTLIAARAGRFRLAQNLAATFSRILFPRRREMPLPAWTGWGYAKDFPHPAAQPFRARFQAERAHLATEGAPKPHEGRFFTAEKASAVQNDTSTEDLSKYEEQNQSLPDRFEAEWTALGGHLTRCTAETLADEIVALLAEDRVDELVAWEADQLPEGVAAALSQAGIRLIHESNPEVETGLTGALGAVASTGTLILTSGPGRPQTASLLPKQHIAILAEEQIYENLPKAFDLEEIGEASSVALISGPSRTADIEMTLTIGVHGPGEVRVFLLEA
jgi:L-lactate dehydrogenase complex protein LldF